jgi:hypothetical protein
MYEKVTEIRKPGRLPGESAKAYRAFGYYREQGPERSLRSAWRKYCTDSGRAETPCPGRWNSWSSKFHWVERAEAHDREEEAIMHAAHKAQLRKVGQRQSAFNLRKQVGLENHHARMERLFEKAELVPITDVTQTKTEVDGKKITTNKTTAKGLDMSGYAKLTRER